MLRWPRREEVLAAARRYAELLLRSDGRVLRVGLVGSYARGDQGPGSDADLLVELDRCGDPPHLRVLQLPAPRLPVPADLLILTHGEIAELCRRSRRWSREVLEAALWLASRNDTPVEPW